MVTYSCWVESRLGTLGCLLVLPALRAAQTKNMRIRLIRNSQSEPSD